jgi:hypothetical protein
MIRDRASDFFLARLIAMTMVGHHRRSSEIGRRPEPPP